MYDESCFSGINCLNELKVSISVIGIDRIESKINLQYGTDCLSTGRRCRSGGLCAALTHEPISRLG